MAPKPRTCDELVAQFYALIARTEDEDACWLWTGRVNKQGYGRMSVKGKEQLAHRLAYALATGQDPLGFCVLHECDNPPCCNPKHLSPGNRSENARQRTERGRSRGFPTISEDTARLIVSEFAGGRGEQKALAEKYGTTLAVVHALVRGKTKAFAHLNWKEARP